MANHVKIQEVEWTRHFLIYYQLLSSKSTCYYLSLFPALDNAKVLDFNYFNYFPVASIFIVNYFLSEYEMALYTFYEILSNLTLTW